MQADWINALVAFWQGLGGAPLTTLRVVGVLLAAWIAVRLAHHGIRAAERRISDRLTDRESAKRAGTLAQVSRYAVSVVLWVLAGIMVLSELGVSVAPILGAVGVVGIAVGFGAQSLVKDYFNGFFILVENQIRQGDVVRIGDHTGLVEEVTLRYVRLRDYEGNVHFVPNGMITSVVSMSRDFSYAVVDIGVGKNWREAH
jgi:small conductance mechanosensitive channel